MSEPLLAHPNFNKTFYLFCDASNSGVGAVLMQSENTTEKKLKPIAYFSKSLNATQRRYSITKKEFFAIHLALREFQYLCLGYEIVLMTDHKPITPFFGTKLPLDNAMARWSIEASSYNCQIRYFEGKRNVVADTLSRLDEDMVENCEVISDRKTEVDEVENLLVTTRSKARNDHKEVENDSDNSDSETDEEAEKVNKEKPFLNYIPNYKDITWSLRELLEHQRKDPFCLEVLEVLEKKQVQKIKDVAEFFVLDKILYKHRKVDTRASNLVNYVIPSDMMNKAINSIHYNTHAGIENSLFNFRLRYFHPNERTFIKNFIKNCQVCKILKTSLDTPIKLLNAPVPTKPFETVSFDFVGPFVTTDNHNRYILSITDLYSRFCDLHAVPNKHTNTVIDCLNETFNKYGFPKTLLSDNALEFTSKAVEVYSNLHNIYCLLYTSPSPRDKRQSRMPSSA